jgi:tripartite-type tricarboxylate transporter receptor subunit TctC
MKSRIVFILFVLGALLMPGFVLGAEYPTREIEFISAFAPGSGNDNFSRIAAKFGEKYVGKPIIVVNKAGAGGLRGYSAIAAAKPDGYTMGLIASAIVAAPYVVKGVTLNYKKNFIPIAQVDYSAQGLSVKKGGPYDIPLKELIKKAKEKPNSLKVGIGGTWTTQDFTRAIFEDEAGIKLIKVPFPGGADSTTALLGGHVDMEVGPSTHFSPLYKGGKINVLALSTEKRNPKFPEIPTFRELGYDVVLTGIHYVAVPAGTPESIVSFLADAFKKAFAESAFEKATENLGATPEWKGPAESMKSMEEMDQVYQKIVKKYDLKPQ